MFEIIRESKNIHLMCGRVLALVEFDAPPSTRSVVYVISSQSISYIVRIYKTLYRLQTF